MGCAFAFSATCRGVTAPSNRPPANGVTGTSARTVTLTVPPLESMTSRPSSGRVPAQVVAAHLYRDDRFVAELEDFLRLAGRVAQGEPFAVGGDGAIQQAHARVAQVQFDGAVAAHRQPAEVDRGRLGLELGRLEDLAGQLGKQLVQAAVGIGEPGRLLGGDGEIDAPEPTEERCEEALFEQIESGGPVLLTADGELVEVAAGLAVGKDERRRKQR